VDTANWVFTSPNFNPNRHSLKGDQLMKKQTGENATRALKLFRDVTTKLVKVAGTEPALERVGDGLLKALNAAVAIAISETEKDLGRMSASGLRRLESRLVTFHAIEDLEAAIQLGDGDSKKEIIDAIKGVIKKLKHLLPIPPKWKTIIDLILTIINTLL
jgi:hypothetical protein